MNFEFDEIGQIIAIGAFFVSSICFLLRRYTDMQEVLLFFLKIKIPILFVSAVLLAFLYSIGILVQSISKNTIAHQKEGMGYIIPNFILKRDNVIRKESFDDFFEKCSPRQKAIMSRMIEDEFKLYLPVTDSSINAIFYESKNTIFNKIEYYPELKNIENKLFFSTSLTFISWILIIIFVVYFLYKFFKYQWWLKGKRIKFLNVFRFDFYYLILLVFLLFAGRLSYRSTQTSFNLRIFGYYTTYIANR
jgi:hypothetical protein